MNQDDLEQKVLAEQVRMLYSGAPLVYRFTVVNACLVYGVLGLYLPESRLLPWLGVILVITLARYVLVALYWRADTERLDARRWGRWLAAGALAAGAAWGSLALVPGKAAPVWIQSFISFVLAGMATGALISLAPRRAIAVPHILLVLLPLPVVLAYHGDTRRLAMALMATFLLVLLIRVAFRIHDIIESGIRLKLQNEEMFRIFEKANQAHPPG